MYERIDVRPIAGACGAEIEGVDLARPLDEATFAEVHRALLEHLVIFFHGQDLTPDQQIAFARRFGELRISGQYQPLDDHPEILEIVKEPDATGIVGNMWHCDESFLPLPALGSVLYMIECPDAGGDTMFANQYLAYEALSPGMQRMLGAMRAVYSDATLQGRNTGRSLKVRQDAGDRPVYEAVHPVVRTHPGTGRKCLFAHRPYTIRFEDMTEAESRPLLEYLFEHAARPEFTCRFRWKAGSLAFWDNRCSQHYALNDYQGVRRYAHRITIVGEAPEF
jgi:taurine dioxygenase